MIADVHRIHMPLSWTLAQAGGDPLILERLRARSRRNVGFYIAALPSEVAEFFGTPGVQRAVVDDFGNLVRVS